MYVHHYYIYTRVQAQADCSFPHCRLCSLAQFQMKRHAADGWRRKFHCSLAFIRNCVRLARLTDIIIIIIITLSMKICYVLELPEPMRRRNKCSYLKYKSLCELDNKFWLKIESAHHEFFAFSKWQFACVWACVCMCVSTCVLSRYYY